MSVGNTGTITTTGVMEGPLGLSTDGILYSAVGLYLVGLDVPYVGDDGGWVVVGSGVFPTYVGIRVWVVVPHWEDPFYLLKPCFSGKQGNEYVCWSEDGATLPFTVPPLPIDPDPRLGTSPPPFNPFDILLTTTDEAFTYTAEDILTVVHRTYTTNSYKLRSSFPPPYDVGVRSTDSEDFGG